MQISELANAGCSVWLDDLSRAKLTGTDAHSLPPRIKNSGVVGVTTNPAIFKSAISDATEYASDIAALKGKSVEEVITKLTTDDVRQACDLFADIYRNTKGVDGRVSIEVDPRSAHDTVATVTEGKALWQIVDRPNLLIKVPATLAGLPAITELIGAGISVNVTLIFSIERYVQVIEAFIAGIEVAAKNGNDLTQIHSVASFFISRLDTAIDPLLKADGGDLANSLLGAAAIANAHLAYEQFEKQFASDRWQSLAAQGSNAQRPLWASTGVKDPAYEDTRYVLELVAPHTVNTMPQSTLDAVIDHGVFKGNTIAGKYDQARLVFQELAELGISIDKVTADLEADGVKKFADAWNELLASVKGAMA
ncbi:MipB Transaldolase [Candidatus Nanopelagicaceae bacterium]